MLINPYINSPAFSHPNFGHNRAQYLASFAASCGHEIKSELEVWELN